MIIARLVATRPTAVVGRTTAGSGTGVVGASGTVSAVVVVVSVTHGGAPLNLPAVVL
jgi:hypothetical protein